MRTLKRMIGAAVAGAGLVAAMSMTAAAAPQFVKGTIDANGGLKGRIAPSVHTDSNYLYRDGAKVSIDCRTKGTFVGGNAEWYLLAGEGDAHWVSARYVDLAGAKPGWCGPDRTISAKITKDTYSYQGPSRSDQKRRLQHAGGGQEVLCSTYTNAGGGARWVVTIEDGWIPASAVKASRTIPFCEH